MCASLEKEETSDQKFFVDKWQRKEVQLCEFRLIVYVFVPSLCLVCALCVSVVTWQGGGGVTCIMTDGSVFERAGVNVSVVHGKLKAAAVQQMRAR